jgi:adenylylsulfate kinase
MTDNGFILWFTGLSGAGKSTLAEYLTPILRERGTRVEVLDGDVVRTNLSKGLGFTKEDRDTNILRIGFVASLLARNGVCSITAAISPYAEIRDTVRAECHNFIDQLHSQETQGSGPRPHRYRPLCRGSSSASEAKRSSSPSH